MVGLCKFSDVVASGVREVCGEPTSILELGCGPGGNLAKFPKSSCLGIDHLAAKEVDDIILDYT